MSEATTDTVADGRTTYERQGVIAASTLEGRKPGETRGERRSRDPLAVVPLFLPRFKLPVASHGDHFYISNDVMPTQEKPAEKLRKAVAYSKRCHSVPSRSLPRA